MAATPLTDGQTDGHNLIPLLKVEVKTVTKKKKSISLTKLLTIGAAIGPNLAIIEQVPIQLLRIEVGNISDE